MFAVNNFLNTIKEKVASTICLTNTRMLPRQEFEEDFARVSISNRNTESLDDYVELNIKNQFNGKNAIIYIRASTKEQCTDAQKFACDVYCNDNKLHVTKYYIEKCSAYKKNSQLFLNKLISENENTNLIIFSVDRFSRNVKKSDELIAKLESKKIVLISVKENINLNTAFGKHSFRNYVNTAQYESELISERVKNSIKYRKANNIHIGKAPYGYKIENRKLVKNEEEFAVIEFIIKNVSKKKSSSQLSLELYKLLTKLGRPESDFVPIIFTLEDSNYEYESYMDNIKIDINYGILCNALNDYNITKQNKKWTTVGMSRTIKNVSVYQMKHLRV